MTDQRYVGMPDFMVRAARRRALRDRDSVLLAALPPLPSEDDEDDDPPVPGPISMPRVFDLGTLQILIRRATQDPRIVPFAVKAAARLGRVQDLPTGWVAGQVVHVGRRTVRLSDVDGELGLADVVGTDSRRQALLDDPDEGTELDDATAAVLVQLIDPPEPPVRLVLLPGAAERLRQVAYGRGRGRR